MNQETPRLENGTGLDARGTTVLSRRLVWLPRLPRDSEDESGAVGGEIIQQDR